MPTLLISTWRLPAAESLAGAAVRRGWQVFGLDRHPNPPIEPPAVFYGGSDVADQVAARFDLALLEPSFDLLVRTPAALLRRAIGYARYDELAPLEQPIFVKPADVRRKAFDAGIYQDVRNARLEATLDPRMPVLISEPVEWLEEHRCFVLNGRVVAASPYLRFGRPAWRPYQEGEPWLLPAGAQEVCEQLLRQSDLALPPAFVVDVGLIHERGWAIVEYNPAWCSSLLGCDPQSVLPVLERVCVSRAQLIAADQTWLAREVGPSTFTEMALRPSFQVVAHAGAMT
jgi:hypothetical protein